MPSSRTDSDPDGGGEVGPGTVADAPPSRPSPPLPKQPHHPLCVPTPEVPGGSARPRAAAWVAVVFAPQSGPSTARGEITSRWSVRRIAARPCRRPDGGCTRMPPDLTNPRATPGTPSRTVSRPTSASRDGPMNHHHDAPPAVYGPDDLAPALEAAPVLEERVPATEVLPQFDPHRDRHPASTRVIGDPDLDRAPSRLRPGGPRPRHDLPE